MNVHGELLRAQVENVAALPAAAPAGRIVYLTSDGNLYIGNGTDWDLLGGSVELQDYIEVKDVGESSQFMAGHIPTLAEINNMLGSNGSVLAMYNFANGSLLDDETGNYDLVDDLPGTINTTGLLNTNYGAYFNFTGVKNGTLLDVTSTLSKGIAVFGWFQADDGQPAGGTAQALVSKKNIASDDIMTLFINSYIRFSTNYNGEGERSLYSSVYLPDGATGFYPFLIQWNSKGKELRVLNTISECDVHTNIMKDGTSMPFCLGIDEEAGALYGYYGKLLHIIVMDAILEQHHYDWLISATVPEPTTIQGKEYKTIDMVQPNGDTEFEIVGDCQVLGKYNNKLHIQGYQYDEEDKVKLKAVRV